jgi:hypothetical protein
MLVGVDPPEPQSLSDFEKMGKVDLIRPVTSEGVDLALI